MSRSPESATEQNNEVVTTLIQELEAARKLTELRDKKEALEALMAKIEDVASFPESLIFDIQSLDGLPFSKQHSIVNWEFNILTSWLDENKPAAFKFQKIVDKLFSNARIN